MNGISTHIKLAPESPVSLPPREDTARRQTAVYESGSGPSPDPIIIKPLPIFSLFTHTEPTYP